MISFLEEIVANIHQEDLPNLYQHCYIFPTKRAANHFTSLLKKKYSEDNFIFPEALTIEEFITTYSTFIIQEEWYLLIELYSIQYELTQSHQAFENFLPWGKLILRDFDECDKYLVDARQFFSVLKAHKEIDEMFVLSDELKSYIERFILTASSQKENKYKEAFLKTWSLLGEMYQLLQERLRNQQFAYGGMAYKDVLERLSNNSLKLPYTSVSFCGFNALSLCEEEIFKTIETQYTTAFWWDADELFLQNIFHEAGNFLREYQRKFSGKNNHWISSNELLQNKNIQIIGISSEIGQAQFVAQQLTEKVTKKTAVVLCNEQLLFPLLYSIEIENINVTMGYSVAQSELYLYINALLNLYCNARITEKQIDFYHKDIQTLSEHAFLKSQIKDRKKLEEILPLFIPYMPQEVLLSFFPEHIITTSVDTIEIIQNVLSVIYNLSFKGNYFLATKEVLIHQLKQLIHLFKNLNSIIPNDAKSNRKALPFMIKQFIGSAKIPFETNTENPIQVMGFLETRIMDFEQLFILSLNDDKLPGSNKTNSFIPYNLRKIFKLPTFEQFDGINAYHFYRLLKRASTIYLLYNNQSDDNAGEKSRFIRQIQHDLIAETNTITESVATYNNANNEIKNDTEPTSKNLLSIAKTPEMTALLKERKFSPSALKVYIKCPLQFYLKYVEGIEEPEELTEEIDAAVFGRILHKVLEQIYQPYLNKVLTSSKIEAFTDSIFINNELKIACETLDLPKEITQGSNRLLLKVIERITQKILQNDAKEESLTVSHVENKFIWDKLRLEDGTFAIIQGTFDRVDTLGENAVRIVDYKTGQIELPAFPDSLDEKNVKDFLDQLFIFKKKDYSVAFQGILYALMYYKLYNCTKIYVGYHHAKKMKNGMTYLNEGQYIPIEILLKFEERLSILVSDIIYKEPTFTQSANEEAYKYSAYADLLGV